MSVSAAQKGTPQQVLQELGRWESERMVRRYAHFSSVLHNEPRCGRNGSQSPDREHQ